MSNETIERLVPVIQWNSIEARDEAEMVPSSDSGLLRYIRESDHERIVKELEARIAALTASWCMCGHLKTSHGFFDDHDECYQCDHASEDLCCEWRPDVAKPAQPSLADAIKEVEKMRDEYEQERKRRVDLYLEGDLYQDGRVKAAEEIVTALKSLGED